MFLRISKFWVADFLLRVNSIEFFDVVNSVELADSDGWELADSCASDCSNERVAYMGFVIRPKTRVQSNRPKVKPEACRKKI